MPGKKSNLVYNFVEKKMNKTIIKSHPWKFFIEVSLSCNLRCIICGHHFSNISGIMKAEVFDHIKPLLSYATIVHEMGYGEPLLDKKFLDKLQFFKEKGAYVDIYTNGMLLSEKVSEKIVDLGLDQITFSIDGGTKETFENIRLGASYSKLCHNIELLNHVKLKRKCVKPFLRANFVGMRCNIEELPSMIIRSAKLGIKEIVLSDFAPPDKSLVHESLYYFPDISNDIICKSKKLAAEYKINFIAPSVFSKPELHQKSNAPVDMADKFIEEDGLRTEEKSGPPSLKHKFPCYEPWQTLYVTWDGNVRPCCVIEESFGNLMNETLVEIWNGKKYQTLRNSVNTRRPVFESCRHCLLRKRVNFSFSNKISMLINLTRNNGLSHTVRKSLKYLLEYF
jgi:radical SAM protein with 4Fe4S-binding SPASM domain